jgi:hypothetical protein
MVLLQSTALELPRKTEDINICWDSKEYPPNINQTRYRPE